MKYLFSIKTENDLFIYLYIFFLLYGWETLLYVKCSPYIIRIFKRPLKEINSLVNEICNFSDKYACYLSLVRISCKWWIIKPALDHILMVVYLTEQHIMHIFLTWISIVTIDGF